MRKRALLLMAVLLCASCAAWAEDANYDPLARNLIFVEGEAEIDVPVNGLRLTFDFDIERESFEEAMQDSGRIIETIESQVKTLGLSKVEFIKGWDIVRQAMISLGNKGRKISNRLTIQATDYPKERLHELLARIIDMSIAVDKAVTLQDMSIFVSDDVEAQKRGEAQTAALKSLDENAAKAAEAVGRKLKMPKRIFVTNREFVGQDAEVNAGAYVSGSLKMYESRRALVSVQKSFRVKGAVVDSIRMKANVTGVYEIE